MTVYPQEYKLNCTKIGIHMYGISMSIGNTALANYTNCIDDIYTNNCPGTELLDSTNSIRYTVNVTWDGMTVSSGSISQSTIGDQKYQCVLDNPSGGDDRIRNLTIKSNVCSECTCIILPNIMMLFFYISTSNCSHFSY